jgi:hypothetical protein
MMDIVLVEAAGDGEDAQKGLGVTSCTDKVRST